MASLEQDFVIRVGEGQNNYVEWWQATHQTDDTAAEMWASASLPHRQHVLAALILLSPVTSVYEIGCGAGPNLRRIQEHAPSIRLGGAEPCETLAAWTERHLGISVDRTALPEVTNGFAWDVVLSCYTLAYLDVPDVMTVLRTLRSRTHRALVLIEPDPLGFEGLGERKGGIPTWFHDYVKLLPAAGWTLRWRWPMVPVEALRTVIVAT